MRLKQTSLLFEVTSWCLGFRSAHRQVMSKCTALSNLLYYPTEGPIMLWRVLGAAMTNFDVQQTIYIGRKSSD